VRGPSEYASARGPWPGPARAAERYSCCSSRHGLRRYRSGSPALIEKAGHGKQFGHARAMGSALWSMRHRPSRPFPKERSGKGWCHGGARSVYRRLGRRPDRGYGAGDEKWPPGPDQPAPGTVIAEYGPIKQRTHTRRNQELPVSTAEFRNGLKIEIDGEPYIIVEFQHVKRARAGPLFGPR